MKANKNFTMVELLAVIVIIMILAGILIGGISYATKRADVVKTMSLMAHLEMALETFKTDYGYYPTCANPEEVFFQMDGTSAKLYLCLPTLSNKFLFVKKGTENQKLLEIGTLTPGTLEKWEDAWGNAFKYQYPGTKNPGGYDLWSCGPDGTSLNDDDIANWKRN